MKIVSYSKDATNTLRRMPVNVAALIVSKIEIYAAEPAVLANNVTALKGRPGEARLRVGNWRVILADIDDGVTVVKIGPRGSVYEE